MSTQLALREFAALYRISGLMLASEIPLPELIPVARPAGARDADIHIRMGLGTAQRIPQPSPIMSLRLPTSEPNLTCTKEPGGYRLRFPGYADFRVDSCGTEIVCETVAGIPPATIRHLLLDQVIPRTLSLRGIDALHATAVHTPYGVCAFTGLSGAGKSTLAASFHLAGCQVLSDDCLVLREESDTIMATPAYPGVRLCEDAAAELYGESENMLPVAHYSSKRRVLADSAHDLFPAGPVALARIYLLVDAPEAERDSASAGWVLEEIAGREAFMSLVESVFRLDISDRKLLARQFDFFERVISRVPVRRLHVSADFQALPAIRKAIFADLGVGGASGDAVL